MTSTRIRSVVCATAIAAGLALAGTATQDALACGWPETCEQRLPSVDIGDATNGNGGSVTGTCTGAAGAATSLNRATYVVTASATSTTTNTKAVPVGTAVVCHIIDAANGTVYGTARGGLPGPAAEAAGTATIPNGREIRVCVDSNAVFSDGSTARDSTC